MGNSSKKGGDTQDIPEIDPQQLIQQATAANRVNTVTPFGSQTYNGNTLTTALSPEMQALFSQQMARAGGPANQFQLQPQTADVLNGLNTRLNQRYGIALPPPVAGPSGGNGSTPGAGGGAAPGNTPSLPPVTQPSPIQGNPQPLPMPGWDNQPGWDYASSDDDLHGQAAAGAHYGNGSQGGMCVTVDSWLAYDTRADQVAVGDIFPVHLPEVGFHKWRVESVGAPAHVHCVELKTKGGAVLRVSMTTPFTLPSAKHDLEEGHTKLAPDMKGESVFVLTPAGTIEDEVVSVTEIGKEWVQPISFGGRSFPAGDTPNALIYSHNMIKDNYGVSGIPAQGADYTMASQTSGPLSGSVSQGTGGISAYNPANSYSGAGGYLGSGSYAGMGQGLAAAAGNPIANQAPNYSSGSGGPTYYGNNGPLGDLGGFGLPSAPDIAYQGGNFVPGQMPTLPGQQKPGFLAGLEDAKWLAPAASILLGPLGGLAAKGYQAYQNRDEK